MPDVNGMASYTSTPRSEINTVSGASESDATSFWSRYEHIKYNDVMKNVLIEDLISRYDHLLRKHNEHVEERVPDHGRIQILMDELQQRRSDCAHLQRILNRDPYILVLLDGDDMVFSLLNQGESGGSQAATLLHNAVTQWTANNVAECPSDVKVVVRAYASFSGLAGLCARAGIADANAKVEGFARCFSQGKILFDFIDIGAGKDEYAKIPETFKLFLYDYHCRQILFGCGHDSSYAGLLDQYAHDEEAKLRVTLLEGTPFDKELNALPFRKTNFPGIFRNNKSSGPQKIDLSADLRPRIDSRTALNGTSGVFTPRTGTPTCIYSPPGNAFSLSSPGVVTPGQHARTTSMASSDAPASFGWSAVAKKNAHLPLKDTTRQLVPEADPSVKRNRAGQRLDIELDYDRDEVQRVKKLKACNQHYIGAGCCHWLASKEDKCPHNHKYNLSNAELKTLRVVARETPCKRGHECDDPKCIYGHHCPFPLAMEGSMRGVGCLNGHDCRFPKSMHGMDLHPFKLTRITGAF